MSIVEDGANVLYFNNNADTISDSYGRNNSTDDKWDSGKCGSTANRSYVLDVECYTKTTDEQHAFDSLHQTALIFRYKFTEEFMEELYKFSKIHQYDERNDFKEAWVIWKEENETIVEEETNRLKRLGYIGDVIDKMFKSARYYFRKKSTEKQEPKQRRKYITVKKELLDAMDLHIETNYLNEGYQPKIGYTQFCEENVELIKKIVDKIVETGENDMQTINDKIKKTYKNRYFIIVKK
jgi:hypothetical protein